MYEFSSSVDLIMIGTKDCTKDQLVLEKLKTMKVDDIFDIPNVFQVSFGIVNYNLLNN